MLTDIQYRILKRIAPAAQMTYDEHAYAGKSKLAAVMGDEFLKEIVGRTVVDFGCGEGTEALEMARRGARRVIGVEIRDDLIQAANERAHDQGLADRCIFVLSTRETADIVVSVDAFEHFSDPAEILRIMATFLAPDGEVRISFGPTWFHPLGGHLFSVFPWAHLVFSEKALIRWRSDFKSDGATRFGEVAGGLNQMTIAGFEKLIAGSPFRVKRLELVPIAKLKRFHCRLTREFTTAVVRCTLVKRP